MNTIYITNSNTIAHLKYRLTYKSTHTPLVNIPKGTPCAVRQSNTEVFRLTKPIPLAYEGPRTTEYSSVPKVKEQRLRLLARASILGIGEYSEYQRRLSSTSCWHDEQIWSSIASSKSKPTDLKVRRRAPWNCRKSRRKGLLKVVDLMKAVDWRCFPPSIERCSNGEADIKVVRYGQKSEPGSQLIARRRRRVSSGQGYDIINSIR